MLSRARQCRLTAAEALGHANMCTKLYRSGKRHAALSLAEAKRCRGRLQRAAQLQRTRAMSPCAVLARPTGLKITGCCARDLRGQRRSEKSTVRAPDVERRPASSPSMRTRLRYRR